jgi:GntR family transcriptional regulator / MocR family aminotransferase
MSDFWATFGVDLHLDLDPAAGRRGGLEAGLRDAIRGGRLAPGTRLPSTRALAGEIGLARGTVTAVYDQLTAEGYLIARRGSGTEVAALASSLAAAPPNPLEPAEPRHDLRPGRPDVSAFPTAAWLRAYRRALNAAPASAYGYGDPAGRIELRTALAEYLGRTRGVSVSPDRVVITTGYVQALALIARVLRDMGIAAMAMEDPGLPLHRDVVTRAGMPIAPLPVDDQGARADLLTTGEHARTGAVVVTPAHQYPAGATLHPTRRHALAQWARTTGAVIIEDDYDGEFRYDRQPVGALQGMAPDQVVYLGTASKTIGPALRLAWMVLPRPLVAPIVEAKRHADHQSESLGQLALADLITSHVYDRHVRACRLRYRRRRDLLLTRLDALAKQSAREAFRVHGIAAGLHALITLPTGVAEDDVLDRAAREELAIDGLAEHHHHPAPQHPQGIIVGYGTPSERAYPAALDALVRVLAEVRRG